MENEVRSGTLLVQKGSGLVKKFQKRWAALYKRSSHGVSRLEVYDSKENYDRRMKGAKKHLISLGACATITKNSVNEGKKKEYVIQLTFNDNKEHILQAESEEELELWYSALSSVIFGGGDLLDNVIYSEYEKDGYEVVLKQNDVAKKHNLQGNYSLHVSKEDVELRDKLTKQLVAKWPLQLLRKYGRDKQEFSLEAGRRCPTGPGMFYFITDHYNAIFQDVDNNVRNLAERGRAHSTSSMKATPSPTFSANPPPDSPLPTSPVPSSANYEQSLYDDPIDMRKNIPKVEESIYNEPVNSKPSRKQRPTAKPASPKNLKPEKTGGKDGKTPAGPPKPDRSQPNKWAPPISGGKKDQKKGKASKNRSPSPAPPQIEDATYAEAFVEGAVSEADAYGHLNFDNAGASNGDQNNQYDSLSVGWAGGSQTPAVEDSEYATAGDIQRFKGLSTGEDGLYDKVKR